MLVLRCTTKYRARMSLPRSLPDLPEPENALGSWYANLLNVGGGRFLHYMSSRSLLSVIIPLREARTAEGRLRSAMERVLRHIGAPTPSIAAEMAALSAAGHSQARNRSILASMRDQAGGAAFQFRRGFSAEQVSEILVVTPCGPMDHQSPERVSRRLLEETWGS